MPALTKRGTHTNEQIIQKLNIFGLDKLNKITNFWCKCSKLSLCVCSIVCVVYCVCVCVCVVTSVVLLLVRTYSEGHVVLTASSRGRQTQSPGGQTRQRGTLLQNTGEIMDDILSGSHQNPLQTTFDSVYVSNVLEPSLRCYMYFP